MNHYWLPNSGENFLLKSLTKIYQTDSRRSCHREWGDVLTVGTAEARKICHSERQGIDSKRILWLSAVASGRNHQNQLITKKADRR